MLRGAQGASAVYETDSCRLQGLGLIYTYVCVLGAMSCARSCQAVLAQRKGRLLPTGVRLRVLLPVAVCGCFSFVYMVCGVCMHRVKLFMRQPAFPPVQVLSRSMSESWVVGWVTRLGTSQAHVCVPLLSCLTGTLDCYWLFVVYYSIMHQIRTWSPSLHCKPCSVLHTSMWATHKS